MDMLYWATSDDDSVYDDAVIEVCDLEGNNRMTLAPTKEFEARPFAWGITLVRHTAVKEETARNP